MKLLSWIGVGLIVAVTSGCATRQIVATPLAESRIGAKHYEDMQYQPLPFGEARTIAFDADSSPVARFPDGLGVYSAFALNPQSADTHLRVRTWFSSGWMPLAGAVKPYVMFLDADKHVISNIQSFHGTDGSTFVKGGYRQGYFPVPLNARFFIVYSAASESDRMILSSQTGKIWAIPNTYSGTVEVKQESAQQ